MTSNTKYIDYLNEDEPIPGQLWVCISFLSPEGIKNCSIRGLKIRGIYGTKQEADKRAEYLQKMDPDFHVFVGEVGKWLPWDPDPNDIEDQIYQEKQLNDLMKGYKENLGNAKRMEQQRKDDMIKQAAIEEKSKKEKINNRLKKKLEARKQQKKMNDIVNKSLKKSNDETKSEEKPMTDAEKKLQEYENKLKEEEELIKSEKQKINKKKDQIEEKKQTIESIDSKLLKIQELYEKLNKKN